MNEPSSTTPSDKQSAGNSTRRSFVAGAAGGVIAVVALTAIAALLLRRFGPRLMPAMMERMMTDGRCSEQMRACMERCGCAQPASSG
jgi:hypothetical protein